MFERLRTECSQTILGEDHDLSRAREHVERSITHKDAKNRCKSCDSNGEFPEEIRTFANVFVSLYENRIKADYDDKGCLFRKEDAESLISSAEAAIVSLNGADVIHRRAFVAWVCFVRRNLGD